MRQPEEQQKVGVTGKRIQQRAIVSSIKPKIDDQFFVDLQFCTICVQEIRTFRTGSQLVQNTKVNKEWIVKLWLN